MAELRLEPPAEVVEELLLGELPALEPEQRVLAVALGDALHSTAELLHRDAGLVLERGEGLDQVVRQDAAEVADHRPQRRGCLMRPPRSRTTRTPARRPGLKRNNVSDARVPGSAPCDAACRLAGEPAGELVPGPEQLRARLHRAGRPRRTRSTARTVSKARGRRLAGAGRVAADELLAVAWAPGRLHGGDRQQRHPRRGRDRQEPRPRRSAPTGPQRWTRTAGASTARRCPPISAVPCARAQLRVAVQPGRAAGRRRGGLREVGGRGQRVQLELDPGLRRVERSLQRSSGCSIVEPQRPGRRMLPVLHAGADVLRRSRARARPSANTSAVTLARPRRRSARDPRRDQQRLVAALHVDDVAERAGAASAPARRRARSSLRRVGPAGGSSAGGRRGVGRAVGRGVLGAARARPPITTRAHPSRGGAASSGSAARRNAARVGGISSSSPKRR